MKRRIVFIILCAVGAWCCSVPSSNRRTSPISPCFRGSCSLSPSVKNSVRWSAGFWMSMRCELVNLKNDAYLGLFSNRRISDYGNLLDLNWVSQHPQGYNMTIFFLSPKFFSRPSDVNIHSTDCRI